MTALGCNTKNTINLHESILTEMIEEERKKEGREKNRKEGKRRHIFSFLKNSK